MSTAIIAVAYLRRSGTRIAQGTTPHGHPTTHSVASSFTAISYGKPIATISQLQLLETERGESNAPEHPRRSVVDGVGFKRKKPHVGKERVALIIVSELTGYLNLVAADLCHRRRESSRAGKDCKASFFTDAAADRNSGLAG